MLQGQKDLLTVGRLILSELAPVVAAQHAVFYVLDTAREEPQLTLLASYAYEGRRARSASQLELGEGLVGQCALEKREDPADERAARLHRRSSPAWARRRRRTSSCCRWCSKAR